jgi:hypothetical protein
VAGLERAEARLQRAGNLLFLETKIAFSQIKLGFAMMRKNVTFRPLSFLKTDLEKSIRLPDLKIRSCKRQWV